MKPATRSAICITVLVAGVWVWWQIPDKRQSAETVVSRTAGEIASAPPDVASAIRAWSPRTTPDLDRASLGEIARRLRELPRAEAVAAILEYLSAGTDRNTALEFEISAGNRIAGWPSLRTFLLDLLLELDPAAAAEASRSILITPTTADEWAIALRNIARAEAAALPREELRAKTEELIRNPAWRENPSIGYLNAFDVLVHIRAVESTPLLSEIVQHKDRRDLAHAGFLALDQLVQLEPVSMLQAIAADAALHQSRPEMVAQQMARADLRDDSQRELVKSWLLDHARTPTELSAFAESYPNHNRFVSHNLLSDPVSISGQTLAAHDRDVAEIIGTWSQDEEFANLQPELRVISTRLSSFISSTAPPT